MISEKLQTSMYKEIKIGKITYRVTSIFSDEKDLGRTLEDILIKKALSKDLPNEFNCPKDI